MHEKNHQIAFPHFSRAVESISMRDGNRKQSVRKLHSMRAISHASHPTWMLFSPVRYLHIWNWIIRIAIKWKRVKSFT